MDIKTMPNRKIDHEALIILEVFLFLNWQKEQHMYIIYMSLKPISGMNFRNI